MLGVAAPLWVFRASQVLVGALMRLTMQRAAWLPFFDNVNVIIFRDHHSSSEF